MPSLLTRLLFSLLLCVALAQLYLYSSSTSSPPPATSLLRRAASAASALAASTSSSSAAPHEDPWRLVRPLQAGRGAAAAAAVAAPPPPPAAPPAAPRAPPPAAPPLAAAAALSLAAAPPPPRPPSDAAIATTTLAHAGRDFFCDNRARGAELAAIDPASMTSFISTGGRFTILLVTCDRAEQLQRSLASLLAVRCVEPGDVIVVADGGCSGTGGGAQVPGIAAGLGVRFHLHARAAASPGEDGAARIASHYGYALSTAFGGGSTGSSPAVIIVEDDLAFSPDFFEYFHAVAGVLESDPSLWLASAWNDNGFDYLVADPLSVRRTRYFPGLGWLLPRAVWEGQLASSWPQTHWDHWLREPNQHRGRDVLYPEVPRSYHMGVKGTFMDTGTHNKYFGSIALANDPSFTWDTPRGAAALEGVALGAYEARLAAMLGAKTTAHLSSVEAITAFTEGVGVVWYSCPCVEPSHDSMRPFAAYFGVWHEGARGSWEGVHELWWLGSAKLFLINVGNGNGGVSSITLPGDVERAPAWVQSFLPSGHTPLRTTSFLSASRPALPQHGGLFNGKWRAPLAHVEGGHDANGPPDDPSAAATASAALAPGLVQVVAVTDHEHEVVDGSGGHAHSKFMGDLHLPSPPPRGAGGGGRGGASAGVARMGVLSAGSKVAAAATPGLDCNTVCAGVEGGGFTCAINLLSLVNDCASLQTAFNCVSCEDSQGSDQPAFISPNAPPSKKPGACLVNTNPGLFSCEGKWEHALRLCPCKAA